MNDSAETKMEQRHADRRRFITMLGAAAFAGTVGRGFGPRLAYGGILAKAERDKLTPDQVIELLKHGNERFRKGEMPTSNYLAEQRATASGQAPVAAILSCIDSRAPAEIIMDLGIGDIFNSRVAGNISNDDILGGLEFACKVFGPKVVLVMGHTSCGAIQGAIDEVKLGHLTRLLVKIRPAVEATTFKGDRSSKNLTFVDAVAAKNVELTISSIRTNSDVLRDLEFTGAIKIVGAMYNLKTGVLQFPA